MDTLHHSRPGEPLLQWASNDEVHDMIAVGFGPASLAIAIALYDDIEEKAAGRRPRHFHPKVRFLERQDEFAWHPGMLLPDSKMQISFMKDFATLRNPKSRFTFLNYLHSEQRLVSFTNLGSMLPLRMEYNDYMQWCASVFEDVVDYSTDVNSIEIDKVEPQTGQIQSFQVISTNLETGEQTTLRARHVVVAVGGRPEIPRAFQGHKDRVIHSSQYLTKDFSKVLSGEAPKRIAVIGGGQSAAEVFFDIPSRFPGAQSVLITRDSALRPSDDSPFVNELFNPERTDDVFHQDPITRAKAIASNKVTNYGVVRLELLDKIYSTLYSYHIQSNDEQKWPHRIINNRHIIKSSKESNALRLQLVNSAANIFNGLPQTEELNVDLVIVACGYDRTAHEDLMQGLQLLMPEDSETWPVNRDYRVQFKNDTVQSDAGIWLQGCNQATHGLPDSLLSILAVRGGEMVRSLFGGAEGNAEVKRKDSKDVQLCDDFSLVV